MIESFFVPNLKFRLGVNVTTIPTIGFISVVNSNVSNIGEMLKRLILNFMMLGFDDHDFKFSLTKVFFQPGKFAESGSAV